MPIHGPWCSTRTYPTRCRYCGDRVFYFTCDCGCKVFFDDLGPPWPEHRCDDYLVARYDPDLVRQIVANPMMTTPGRETGRQIDQNYVAKAKEALDAQRAPEIIGCMPYDNVAAKEEGIVREIIARVDVYRRFQIPSTSPVGASVLGPLAHGSFAQMTINTGALASGDCYSFTFFVDREIRDRTGVVKGDFVTCELTGLTILGHGVVWLCKRLSGAFD